MQRLLSITDLMALELEELELLLQRGNAALVAKARQQTIPTSDQRYASSPVKLNVGGTYFATSLENLTREPGTFFSAMFSGRWEIKTNPKDDAVFVDRSPFVFELIVDYMRKRTIDLDNLSPKQFNALREEADFYQIASLLGLLELFSAGRFFPEILGDIQLSKANSRATNVGDRGEYIYVISLAAFSPSLREMKVKLVKGESVTVGVAPKSILGKGNTFSNCGWHVYGPSGTLYSQNGDSNKPFKRKIHQGSVVTVKMDEEFNISFQVNEEDWGVAFQNVAKDFAVPLYLSVGLLQLGAAVELV